MTFLLPLSAPFFGQIRVVQLRRQQIMIRLKSRHRQTIERERNTPTDNPITTNHSIQSCISRTHRSAAAMTTRIRMPFSTTTTTTNKSNRRPRRLDLALPLIRVLNRPSRAMPSRRRSRAPSQIFHSRLTCPRPCRPRFD